MENILASKTDHEDLYLLESDKYLTYSWVNEFSTTVYEGPYFGRMEAIEDMLNKGYTIKKVFWEE